MPAVDAVAAAAAAAAAAQDIELAVGGEPVMVIFWETVVSIGSTVLVVLLLLLLMLVKLNCCLLGMTRVLFDEVVDDSATTGNGVTSISRLNLFNLVGFAMFAADGEITFTTKHTKKKH